MVASLNIQTGVGVRLNMVKFVNALVRPDECRPMCMGENAHEDIGQDESTHRIAGGLEKKSLLPNRKHTLF